MEEVLTRKEEIVLQKVFFQNDAVIELVDGASRLWIAPEFGARLLAWEVNGEPVIRWPQEADWNHVAKVRGGNPLLFPFVGRHFVQGQLGKWKDAVGKVREMPMHGFARDSRFEVVESRATSGEGKEVRMRLVSNESNQRFFPYDFQFDVVYQLQDNKLTAVLETLNVGKEAFPYYPGHHFYFAIPHEERAAWELRLPCDSWGNQEPSGKIVEQPSTREVMSLADPEIIDRFFMGLRCDRATLKHQDTEKSLDICLEEGGEAPWYAITTWAETPLSDFFCVEPWLGIPDAIHHGKGLRSCPPGGKERAICSVVAHSWGK